MKNACRTAPVFVTVILFLLILFLGGCSPESGPPPHSGFLSDYSSLRPSENVHGAYVWLDDSKPLSVYKMVIIEPVRISLADQDAEAATEEDLGDLARYFEDALGEAMKDSYPIVTQPGFGVLRVRTAITNVKRSRPLINLTPGLSLLGFGIGGAAVEAELIDAQSGKAVVRFVDAERGKRYRKSAGLTPYGDARDVFRTWAMLLRDSLDEARGLHGSSFFRSTGNIWK